MDKRLFITEKPSVAMEFAKALGVTSTKRNNGYIENDDTIITWCVGHLVSMSYPDKYDSDLKHWSLEPLPFIPNKYKYEVLTGTKTQYKVVKELLNRKDIEKIYYAGDSAREGEYIQRLVRQLAGYNKAAEEYRVWIDSQTRDEILNGIRNAKPLSYYNSLSDSAYARAIEDYLTGINLSRALTLKYGYFINNNTDKYTPVAVGRVMSCVLGMIVNKERSIRNTDVQYYYGIKADFKDNEDCSASWIIDKDSIYVNDPDKYKTNGLMSKVKVENLISELSKNSNLQLTDKKTSTSNQQAPLLFNLAELQALCSKKYHINPSMTLKIIQSLYESKLVTYPRTDARVLTKAVAMEIDNILRGLTDITDIASEVLTNNMYSNLTNTKYVNDEAVSDHYAIIPTGITSNVDNLNDLEKAIYDEILIRFLSIFYPATKYKHYNSTFKAGQETFKMSNKVMTDPGWRNVGYMINHVSPTDNLAQIDYLDELNGIIPVNFQINNGKSSVPSRYSTGSIILAMENAGNLIEDDELREQIKSSGIGTSATRADIITKLHKNKYINIDKKTQIITPDKLGEIMYEIINATVPDFLAPEQTANWEKCLELISNKELDFDTYINKINTFITETINDIKNSQKHEIISNNIKKISEIYGGINMAEKNTNNNDEKNVGICPFCGKPTRFNSKALGCTGWKEGCKFTIWKTGLGGKFSEKDILYLVNNSTFKKDKLVESATTPKKMKLHSRNKDVDYEAFVQLSQGDDGKLWYKPVFED